VHVQALTTGRTVPKKAKAGGAQREGAKAGRATVVHYPPPHIVLVRGLGEVKDDDAGRDEGDAEVVPPAVFLLGKEHPEQHHRDHLGRVQCRKPSSLGAYRETETAARRQRKRLAFMDLSFEHHAPKRETFHVSHPGDSGTSLALQENDRWDGGEGRKHVVTLQDLPSSLVGKLTYLSASIEHTMAPMYADPAVANSCCGI